MDVRTNSPLLVQTPVLLPRTGIPLPAVLPLDSTLIDGPELGLRTCLRWWEYLAAFARSTIQMPD